MKTLPTFSASTLATGMGQVLHEHLRCPAHFENFEVDLDPAQNPGYFRLGPEVICYGRYSGRPAKLVTDPLPDALPEVSLRGSTVNLPFAPDEIIDNLRYERYQNNQVRSVAGKSFLRSAYYVVRPLLPVHVRKHLQKTYLRGWSDLPFPSWPVDHTVESVLEHLLVWAMRARGVERIPFIWFWPDGARSCLILTHDVESQAGVGFCNRLMDLNDSFGFKSSFQIVPEKRYSVQPRFLEAVRQRGFEVNVHDLNHDGLLFSNREEFLRRAERIRHYRREFGAEGFRAAVMYRNPDWYEALDFSYDMSFPNVAHLDPQRGGCCTVFPFFIGDMVELPLTTVQDYPLFHVLSDYSIGLWQKQISVISKRHGLISFIVHPDYIIDEAPRRVYTDLLQHLAAMRTHGDLWSALPKDVASWWRMRSRMELVREGSGWRIEGEGSERASLAYAVLRNGTIGYECPFHSSDKSCDEQPS